MIKRAYGCLIGSAIGDAMGMPASFMSPEKIKQVYGRITGFLPPDKEQVVHGSLDAGEVTDDTEESLIIAAVLEEAGRFDPALFIKKMRDWAVETKILESTIIGPSTRRFLNAVVNGEDPQEAGKIGDTNGGAMRVAPIGIFYHGDVSQAIRAGLASGRLSHGSRPGLASTAAIAAAIAVAVEGNCTPQEVMAAAVQGAEAGEKEGFDIPAPSVARRIRLAIELVDRHRERSMDEISYLLYQIIGAGMKSYESIPLSLGIFYAAKGDYQKGLLAAINVGDDADTNGAITGALCGAYCGSDAIQPAWIEKLHTTNQIDFMRIARRLLDRQGL
ncbi:MAG TPA: ADP-ribosylglycohydrolase family protein [Anaerolineales bacterium]